LGLNGAFVPTLVDENSLNNNPFFSRSPCNTNLRKLWNHQIATHILHVRKDGVTCNFEPTIIKMVQIGGHVHSHYLGQCWRGTHFLRSELHDIQFVKSLNEQPTWIWMSTCMHIWNRCIVINLGCYSHVIVAIFPSSFRFHWTTI
jgi:hypothetical protein